MGAPLFGFLIDRFALNRKMVIVCSTILSLLSWTILLVFGGHASYLIVIPLFLSFGLLGGGALTIFMTITKELFPPWLTGTAVGLMNPAGFLATAFYQPFTGYLLDRVGPLGSGAYPLEAYQHIFIAFLISFTITLMANLMLSLPKKDAS
jgi:MFS family permease